MNGYLKINDDLSLDSIRHDDIDELILYLNDDELHRNTLSVPYPYTYNDAKEFLENGALFVKEFGKMKDWAIRKNEHLIGGISLLYNDGINASTSEFGFWLAPSYRGEGIMSCVVEAFSTWVFSKMSISTLDAYVFEYNPASCRVLEKAGFNFIKFEENAFIKNDQAVNAFFYSKSSI